MSEEVEVTRADRDAAAEYNGRFPELRLTEAFARHRLAERERCAKVAEPWADYHGEPFWICECRSMTPNPEPTMTEKTADLFSVTPEMRSAWLDYEVPSRFVPSVEKGGNFACAAVRDAFFSGWNAARTLSENGKEAGR